MTLLESEDDFREGVIARHRDHFDHFYRLYEFAHMAVESFRGFINDPYDASLSLIYLRAFKSYDAIRRLCEVASCEDAGVILRSLLNLTVVTRWITLDRQVRAKKYVSWYWIQMHNDSKHFAESFPANWIPQIERKFQEHKSLFEYTDSKGKLRLVRHWYEPEARSIFDMFKEVGLEQQYQEGYAPLSGLEHSDAMAFVGMVGGGELISGNERKLEANSEMYLPHYLRNAFQWFGDIFEICNKTLPYADSAELKQILDEGKKFFASDMRARGMAPWRTP